MRRKSLWGALAVAGIASLFAAADGPKPFTPQQRRWWAFQKVTKPSIPQPKNSTWVKNDIDAFVLARLEEKHLMPAPPADRITLIRRATLDLTGLVPTPEEVQAFLSDPAPDAFTKVVDRLLASPRYGERWARHWLDLARYADSEGFKSDETRPNIWRYRDYVIDSFNRDKPYDRFIKEQIAGDELYPQDAAALIATGFNRHFPDESNARKLMERRQEILNDITDTVGATFLGLTFACARCHDHKFDPILQKDYYRLQAFFANTRIEDHAVLDFGEHRIAYEQQYAEWDAKTRDIRAEMHKLAEPQLQALYKENFDKFPPEIQSAITTAPAERTPIQWQMYYKARPQLDHSEDEAAHGLKGDAAERWKVLKAELATFDGIKPAPEPVAQAMIDNGRESAKTHVLAVGVYDAYKEEIQPGFLSILDPGPARIDPPADVNSTGRRTALANWLASAENPLTARVMVNRIWHYHFGRGLVATPSDFGVMGERPANPALLDYLATTFVENGWSIKKMHRLILLSNTYQQSARFNPEAAKADPEDRLLWRYNRHRLEGEAIRDSILEVSGRLNLKMGGPGVFPPLPEGVVTRGGWKKDEDPSEADRRSVYVFVRRNTRYPMFEVFDMPDTHESCPRRNATVTGPQALELLNNELVLDWSRSLAARVSNDAGLTSEAQVDRAWRFVYSRPATAEERREALEFMDSQRAMLGQRLSAGDARKAALADLCHMLVNSNEFLYVN
ncbi:MAG TPA: DUF1549 and DUF1553 domain-containing protein [Bryobacteraceae bacterium]|nr:DUF1549 and DUF1553 domain-containing protein [Bryobacteraceae bacterium]